MKWKVIVRDQVWREIETAADWYRQERNELRNQFIAAVDQAIDLLTENPRLASKRLKKIDVRWIRPARFPYRIIYLLNSEDHTVVVLMLLHDARDDRRWKKQVGKA